MKLLTKTMIVFAAATLLAASKVETPHPPANEQAHQRVPHRTAAGHEDTAFDAQAFLPAMPSAGWGDMLSANWR